MMFAINKNFLVNINNGIQSYLYQINNSFNCDLYFKLKNMLPNDNSNIKYIETKSTEALLIRRKQTLKNFGTLGPADANILFYCKQGSFLSKREQRSIFYFFQGLNVYPQNLSIFLRDYSQRDQKNTKQKLIKGVFVVYDIFEKYDAVIQINIPGALKIFKMGENKQLLSNEAIDRMYLSSMLRTFYQKNLQWGRYFEPFAGDNPINQFKHFLDIFVKNITKNQIYICDEYQHTASIKGSHSSNLIFQYAKSKRIIHHIIDFLNDYIKKNTEAFWQSSKLVILYAECLCAQKKFYKSLKVTSILAEKYYLDPYILYHQAKYLKKLGMPRQAMRILHSIKQFNQFQIWILLAQINVQFRLISDCLLCLNFASKLIKANPTRHTPKYKDFETLGKIKKVQPSDQLQFFPNYLTQVKQPVVLIQKQPKIQQKYKQLTGSDYWKLLPQERIIYKIIVDIRQSFQKKQFENIIEITFQMNFKQYVKVDFKRGLSTGYVIQQQEMEGNIISDNQEEEKQTELPQFLSENRIDKPMQIPQRNLSIIPQIESFIQNSVFEERKKGDVGNQKKYKHILYERLMKIIRSAYHQNSIQSAEIKKNYNFILPVYNRLRKNLYSNYVYKKMFNIFSQTQNYRSVLILIAELLNQLEASGIKKVQKIPYWVQKYILQIINEKGLSHLNQILQKLKFYDEAMIDFIKSCTKWKIKGVQY